MVDLIMPYRRSRWDDTEIKYSLRSIEKHLSNYNQLFIIGDKPKGIKGYVHIPFVDDTRMVYKERNICYKVLMACVDSRVSQEFLFINDDHYLNSDYNVNAFPNYYYSWPVKNDMYSETQKNTKEALNHVYACFDATHAKFLVDCEEEYKFYDVHSPMLFNKVQFEHLMCRFDWDRKAGYCMKSLYGNFIDNHDHIYYPDLKIRLQYPLHELHAMTKDRLWFSTDDGCRSDESEKFLKQLYPTPSIWEIK